MKKILAFVMVIVLTFAFIGCKNSNDSMSDVSVIEQTNGGQEINNYNQSKEEKIIESIEKNFNNIHMKAYKLSCPELLNVVDLVQYECDTNDFCVMFITNDGGLYELSTGLYSNNSHCKKVETDSKFLRFCSVGSHYLLDDKDVFYHYKSRCLDKEEYLNSSEYQVEEREKLKTHSFLTECRELWCFKGNNDTVLCSHITTGGGEYIYGKQQILKLPNNEKVEWFSDNTFKTNQSWYCFEEYCINQAEAEKYVDVKEQYELRLKRLDLDENIIFFKIDTYLGPVAIDDSGTIYLSQYFK